MYVLEKMSDGNPGAARVLSGLLEAAGDIDPDGGNVDVFLFLYGLGISGSDIYVLYNDQCKGDLREFVMLLRACELGFVEKHRLEAVAADQTQTVRFSQEEMNEFDAKVCEALINFRSRSKPLGGR